MHQKDFTQTKAFSDELQKLRFDVTAKDRQSALCQLGIKSTATLSQYLNGDVRDNDTAASLIVFFKNCISRRNLVLLDNSTKQAV